MNIRITEGALEQYNFEGLALVLGMSKLLLLLFLIFRMAPMGGQDWDSLFSQERKSSEYIYRTA